MFESIVLGLVQGLTEFLPISSSGHLIIVRELLGYVDSGVGFDAILHLGTFAAIVIYFRQDFWNLAMAWVRPKGATLFFDAELRKKRILTLYIFAACIPSILAGVIWGDFFEHQARAIWLIVVMLILGGLFLYASDRFGKKTMHYESMTLFDVIMIGFFQAVALLPGTSRSGITMSAGLLAGLKLQEAARFSFLLGAPVILGAGIYSLYQLILDIPAGFSVVPLFVAFIVSFLSGVLAIRLLLSLLQTVGVKVFVYYRLILALILIIAFR